MSTRSTCFHFFFFLLLFLYSNLTKPQVKNASVLLHYILLSIFNDHLKLPDISITFSIIFTKRWMEKCIIYFNKEMIHIDSEIYIMHTNFLISNRILQSLMHSFRINLWQTDKYSLAWKIEGKWNKFFCALHWKLLCTATGWWKFLTIVTLDIWMPCNNNVYFNHFTITIWNEMSTM